MWFGISKGLGGGVRVGVGTRIGSGRRARGSSAGGRRRPTQAELQKHEKEQFLERSHKRALELGEEYATAKGILVKSVDVQDSLDHPVYAFVKDHLEKVFREHRMVKDGGPLTAKRRETILNGLYAVEGLLDEATEYHPLYDAYQQYKQQKYIAHVLFGIAVVCGLISIMFLPLLLGTVIFLVMAGVMQHSAESTGKSSLREIAEEIVSDIGIDKIQRTIKIKDHDSSTVRKELYVSQGLEIKDVESGKESLPDEQLPRNAFLSRLCSWVFSILMVVTGIGLLSLPEGVTAGILFLLIAGLFLPPLRKFFYNRTGKTLSLGKRIGIAVLIFILAAALTPAVENKNDTATTQNSTSFQPEDADE